MALHTSLSLPILLIFVHIFSNSEQLRTPVLKFESQLPEPIINVRSHPDASDIQWGFEGGKVVKQGGKLWLFTAELARAPVNAFMRVALWQADAAAGPWHRVSTIAESNQSFPMVSYWQGVGNQTTPQRLIYSAEYTCDSTDLMASPWAPMPLFDVSEDRWHVLFVGYNCDFTQPWLSNTGNIFGAVSSKAGLDGISGPYTQYGIVAGDNSTVPTPGMPHIYGGLNQIGPFALPGQHGAKYGALTSAQHHWATADSPRGPWRIEKPVSAINTPLAGNFVENPVVTTLIDPMYPAQQSAFVAVFDTVLQETNGFGMATSSDGLHWRAGVDVALPLGCRTPLGLVQDEDGLGATLFFTRRFPDCANQTTPSSGCSSSFCISPAQCANVYAAHFKVLWEEQDMEQV